MATEGINEGSRRRRSANLPRDVEAVRPIRTERLVVWAPTVITLMDVTWLAVRPE